MRGSGTPGSWIAIAAILIGSAAAPSRAQTVDFESAAYQAEKTLVGVDQWAQNNDVLGANADMFKIQSGPDGKSARVLTLGYTAVYRPFTPQTGILDLRWKWRASGDTAHFCLAVSSASLTARGGTRALACLEPNGILSAQGSGLSPSQSATESWKKGVWYYMRLVLDNSQGTDKFAFYIAEDSLRGAERLVLPATAMSGSGGFTRLVLRGEGGAGYVDVDDISWNAASVWLGASDTLWSNAKNWNDNTVPDSLSHVIFASGTVNCALDRNTTVKSIQVASAYKGILNIGQQVLTVNERADFTGGGYLAAGNGHIRFNSPRGNSLTGPEGGHELAPVRHDGPGLLRLDGRALITAGLDQLQGVFDFNGFDMTVTGNLTVKNGQPGTLRNLDGRIIAVGRATRLEGVSKDTLLGLNTAPKGWLLGGSPTDSNTARFAVLGNARASLGAGYAYQSLDAGGNTGWTFLAPPGVVAQPRDTLVKVGQPGWFKVSASSRSAMALQWLRNDMEIPGATDSVYLTPAAVRADSGTAFTCRLTNSIGVTFTNPAKLKVTFPAPAVSPAPKSFSDSLAVQFTASVAGALTYYSRNGSAYQPVPNGLILRDSSLIRAFSTFGPDTSAYAAWIFPKQSQPQLPEPLIYPEPLTFIDSVTVTMGPPVDGARVYYSLDGSVPDSNSLPYTKALVFRTTTTLSAIAYKAGYRPSPVHTHIYIHKEEQTLSLPKAMPAGAGFSDSIVVRLGPPAEAPLATLYYFLGAQGPYRFQDSLVLRQTTTLKALAIYGAQYSDTAIWEFKRSLEAPAASPKGRSFPDTLRIKLTPKAAGTAVFYTTDGSDPTKASRPYPAAGILLDSTAVLKAVAAEGNSLSSILTDTYTLIPDTPSITPRGGDYSSAIAIQLTNRSAKAVIYYTLDGSMPGPDRGLLPYGGPIRLDTSATLRAVAYAGQGPTLQHGPYLSESYTFINPGKRVLGPNQRLDLSSNYALISKAPAGAPVNVEVLAADSLKSPEGFRDILFGVRLSAPDSVSAFPKVAFSAPGGEIRSLYSLNQNGSARFLGAGGTAEVQAPGTYFLAVDTAAPVITYSGEAFTPEDSTRLVVSITDNVSNLSLDLERSDLKSAGFTGHEIARSLLFAVSLKNPAGSLSPLTLRLKVDDHTRASVFPADGAAYPLKQRTTVPVRTPQAFRIGSNALDPWDLIALPLAAEPPLTLSQLRRNNSAPDLEGVTLDRATGNYRYLEAEESLPVGAAIWIASSASLPSLAFPALQTAARRGSANYQLVLHHGWNLVANPSLETLYWPVTRVFTQAYDASLLKGLHGWDASARQYADAESLAPWRGYFAYYKGSRDTVVNLLSQPAAEPAQLPLKGIALKAGADGGLAAGGFGFRLALPGGMALRLGATPQAENDLGIEDEPRPFSPGDKGPRLFSSRGGQRLETDLMRWIPGQVYAWKIVAALPATSPASGPAPIPAPPEAQTSAADGALAAARTLRVEGLSLPEGYRAWAVSRKRGLRFPLAGDTAAPDAGIPLYPGFADSLDILAGPAAQLEARLASVPRSIAAFSARVSAASGAMALDLALPRATRLRLDLWTLDGRALEKEALDLPEGLYHLVRDRRGRRYAPGLYVLDLKWIENGAARRLPLKIAIP